MKILDDDGVIIGGGPAGLGAAVKAKENGCLLYTSRCV